ncbi:MAG: STM3941 family protein [Brachymonas sp.]|nr:STM3941 family protein [Brachymonas sp.]
MNDLPLPPRAIALSKTKLLLLLLLACLFVAVGVWMVQLDPAEIAARGRYKSPWLAHGAGMGSIVCFGAFALFFVKKLFDTKPGLLLTARGIDENASLLAAGFVPWSDIAGFDVYHMQGQRVLVVMLHDPNKYITASRNPLVRKMRQASTRMCGSPVALSANALQIGFDELHELCRQYHKQYGAAQGRTHKAPFSGVAGNAPPR